MRMELLDRLLGKRRSLSAADTRSAIENLRHQIATATNAGEFARAETLCARLIRNFPDAFEGHECMAILCTAQEKHEEAKAHYKKALETTPEESDDGTIMYLMNAQDFEGQTMRARDTVEETERIEREMLELKNKMLPLLNARCPRAHDMKGLPLGLAIDLLTRFGRAVDPDLAEARNGQKHAVDALQKAESAIADVKVLRSQAEEIVAKCAVGRQRNTAARGGPPGSLDAEVAAVLRDYQRKSIPVTIDETVGVAVARIYERLRAEQPLHAERECLRIVTKGRFALVETGNCAVDAVFDPRLRTALSKKAGARGGSLGNFAAVKQAYSEVSDLDPEGGAVRAVLLKEPARLRLLPEHVLHSVVVTYNVSKTVAHAVRIAALADNGIHTMEGNCDGALRVGRFLPFSKITTDIGGIVVMHRRPEKRYGLLPGLPDDKCTDTEMLLALEEVLAETGTMEFFKLDEARIRRFADKPDDWRRMASMVKAPTVLRKRTLAAYDLVRYEDVAEAARRFDRPSDILEHWLACAAGNPSGLLLAIGPASTSGNGSAPLTANEIREIGALMDPEGLDHQPLDIVIKLLGNISREHPEWGEDEHRVIHGLTRRQFDGLSDEVKRQVMILTPHKNDDGSPVFVDTRWDIVKVRLLADRPGFVQVGEGDDVETMSMSVLLDNPLHAVILVGMRIFLEPLVGPGCELTSKERDIVDNIGVWIDPEGEAALLSGT
jgi:hypothetical protein